MHQSLVLGSLRPTTPLGLFPSGLYLVNLGFLHPKLPQQPIHCQLLREHVSQPLGMCRKVIIHRGAMQPRPAPATE